MPSKAPPAALRRHRDPPQWWAATAGSPPDRPHAPAAAEEESRWEQLVSTVDGNDSIVATSSHPISSNAGSDACVYSGRGALRDRLLGNNRAHQAVEQAGTAVDKNRWEKD